VLYLVLAFSEECSQHQLKRIGIVG